MSNEQSSNQQYDTVDPFDRLYGALVGLPDVVASREATITVADLATASTWIVQTIRQRETGDTVFVQRVDKAGAIRVAFPPAVAEAIARQRDTLATKARAKVARQLAAERRHAGIPSGFAAMTRGERLAALAKARRARAAKAAKRAARKAAKAARTAGRPVEVRGKGKRS